MDKMKEKKEGIWVFIHTGSRAHFGRLKGNKQLDDIMRNEIYGIIKNNSALLFSTLIDYFSPVVKVPALDGHGQLQPDPNRPGQPLLGTARETISTSFEFSLSEHTTAVFHIEKIVFLDDLSDSDKKVAMDTIEATLENTLARRMQYAGLLGPNELLPFIDPSKPLPPGVTRMPDTPEGKPHFKVDLRHSK